MNCAFCLPMRLRISTAACCCGSFILKRRVNLPGCILSATGITCLPKQLDTAVHIPWRWPGRPPQTERIQFSLTLGSGSRKRIGAAAHKNDLAGFKFQALSRRVLTDLDKILGLRSTILPMSGTDGAFCLSRMASISSSSRSISCSAFTLEMILL